MQNTAVVVGAGAWGSAVASVLSQNFAQVIVIAKSDKHKQNKDNAAKAILPKNILITTDTNRCYDAGLIFIVTPSQAVRSASFALKQYIKKNAKIIICSKGIEKSSMLLMTEVAEEIIPDREVFFLSGPNFANEVLVKMNSFANLASKHKSVVDVAKQISAKNFFVKPVFDVVCAQICAALKNVMAIFCGMIEGGKFGLNAKAAVATLALQEIKNFCLALGSSGVCIADFCGFGDFVLTCYSENSRNMRFGKLIMKQNMTSRPDFGLVEGVNTLDSAYKIANQKCINAPITKLLYDIIYKNHDAQEQIKKFFKFGYKALW